MTMHAPTSTAFKANAHDALGNVNLQAALRGSRGNFVAKRAKARADLPEFDAAGATGGGT
jgi:L-lactate dehydrogenase complex protein LldF